MTEFLDGPQGRRIAFERQIGQGPGVVFLGGFKSDMRGSKAEYLAQWAARSGRPFLRFDYSGHGESGGDFEDGSIGDWAADAMAAITALTEGPQVLVGSSMGGWISLLVARAMPERVAGLVGIAAAPDFTENGYWAAATPTQREALLRDGRWELPSEYSDAPYVITRRLIEEGRDHLVLQSPLDLPFPVRLLQGTADADVPMDWALRLLDHAQSPDMRLVLVKGADHRFSTPECLGLIEAAIAEVLRG
ncbi:alpha/beta fold hydrolase [Paracoccus sp. S1E-3]|uniref:alpha/beta hydrolase n=1 Tax=Paracoccus sp. S1E-3 TaxID=2756130 RepID=UPI0015EE78B8|nr:alpha/beta fold hydrolase [Paracoccus sp. S1E-3]MBA4489741.1 alpha/beta fold hydrolase [Paracoccus sp. S1E-3]